MEVLKWVSNLGDVLVATRLSQRLQPIAPELNKLGVNDVKYGSGTVYISTPTREAAEAVVATLQSVGLAQGEVQFNAFDDNQAPQS